MGAIPENMAYVGETPWHGIGQYLGEQDVTGKVMLEAAGLNWRIAKRPAFFQNAEGIFVPYEDHWTVARTDTDQPFGQVQGQYTIVQNEEAFQIPDALVNAGEIGYHTAGQLFGGRLVWSLARLGTTMIERLSGGEPDQYDHFLLFVNQHGGHGSVIMGLTTTRAVCENTVDAAVKGMENRIKMNHTPNVQKRIDAAFANLVSLKETSEQEMELIQLLEQSPMNRTEFVEFAEGWLEESRDLKATTDLAKKRRSDAIEELTAFFEGGAGNRGETKGDAYNGVTDWLDHKRREYDDAKKAAAYADRLVDSTLFGRNFKAKGVALKRLATS